jgi:uncharacterized protein
MTLATVREAEPRAATLFYASDDLDLFFLSDMGSLHSQDVMANPRVFVTISQDYEDWQRIQGIQLRGRAELLEDDAHAQQVYLAKFPFVASFPRTGFRYWKVTAEWVRMIDNTLGFAHKDELDLSGSRE